MIAGLGLTGSLIARWLTAAGLRVVVAESGTPMSARAGTHLRNLAWCRADPAFYHDLVRSQLRPVSLPSALAAALPAARQTHIFGGMGTLWNCVAPRLRPDLEHWPLIAQAEWDRLYPLAEEALHVDRYPPGYSRRQDFLLGALAEFSARPAPIAGRLSPDRAPVWTGPAEILAESPLELLSQHVVTRLIHHAGRVTAAEVVALESGRLVTVTADAFVIAAGPLHTPAVLWASDIGRGTDSALGRYLCDHPLCYAQVIIDDALAAGTDPDPVVIIPISGERPFHAVLTCDAYGDQLLEGRIDERLIVSMYWYPIARPRRENRVCFSPGAAGHPGPKLTFEYALDDADRAAQRHALADMREVGERLGVFAPARPPHVLSPGSSFHLLGTTRMGDAPDGESVTDSYGQVWGFGNLYLAGGGLIACASATNPTLTACALAIRTAERITAASLSARTEPTARSTNWSSARSCWDGNPT
jgi:choline dehydrogenase-like flavoprotein